MFWYVLSPIYLPSDGRYTYQTISVDSSFQSHIHIKTFQQIRLSNPIFKFLFVSETVFRSDSEISGGDEPGKQLLDALHSGEIINSCESAWWDDRRFEPRSTASTWSPPCRGVCPTCNNVVPRSELQSNWSQWLVPHDDKKPKLLTCKLILWFVLAPT